MKNITSLLLLCILVFSCKNASDKESTMAENESESISAVEKAPTYKLSLAQWSLNKLIFTGKADPMDFASTAKSMGFEGLEYVSQLYTNENVKFPMKDAGLQNILNELKRRSDSIGIEN